MQLYYLPEILLLKMAVGGVGEGEDSSDIFGASMLSEARKVSSANGRALPVSYPEQWRT